jgi:hypothetical protein
MVDDERDFWAKDIAAKQAVTPVTILREQAARLGPKTNHLVEARVRTSPGSGGKGLVHTFELVVPTLDRYTYQLFSLYHEVEPLYPVMIIEGPDPSERDLVNHLIEQTLLVPRPRSIVSEGHLKDYLRQVLSSEETTRIVNNLMAQARAA